MKNLTLRKIIAAVLFINVFVSADIFGQAAKTPSETEAAQKTDAFLAQWDKNDLPGCGAVNLSFARDGKGKITGFVFNSALDEREVKGIDFKRRAQ